MRSTRLRSGEVMAVAGGGVLAVGSFLPWYQRAGVSPSSWERFGVVTVLIVIAVALAGLLAVSTLTERSPALPVASAVWTTVWGLICVIGILTVVLGHLASLCTGSWMSLIGALIVLGGGWQSLRDERTESYPAVEPPARPPPV